MHAVMSLIKQLKSDEDGATLIEYTVLLAIILVAVIAVRLVNRSNTQRDRLE